MTCGQTVQLPAAPPSWPATAASSAWAPPPFTGPEPTQAMASVPPGALQAAPPPFAPQGRAPAAPSAGSGWLPLVAVAGLALAVGVGVTALFFHTTEQRAPAPARRRPAPSPAQSEPRPVPEQVASPVPPVPVAPPAPPAAQPLPALPSVAMPIVHYRAGVVAAESALGSPDGSYATINAGMLTLQMAAEEHLVSDGTAAPDLQVVVDSSAPGPYRVEIGVGHNVFVAVADGVQGSSLVDLDRFGVRAGRFVRVSTRASGASLALDAVLVRTTAP
ncbi:MAG: hypothetical protein HY909_22835 [Deltaproteobacteria bacterium]|nr:hypothetical protein [Deltaproteobacteria bacterium]